MIVGDTHLPAFVIVSATDIANRAYELYVQRGYVGGFDWEDWLQAERELKNLPNAEGIAGDAKRRG
jgi:hypothetical protein